jgi:hypothetical protein
MRKRLTTIGLVLAVIGLGFVIGGGVAFSKAQEGYGSLQAFSEAQNVNLQYNEEGQLIDRGSPETAQEILSLLTDDWGYPVVEGHLDPADPLVNTATEYMFQMATVGYHVLNGTYTVVLDEAVEYNGETFEPGAYDVAMDGRYWTDLDRMHPLEGPAREMAWSGTVHGLFGELGVGTVTHSALQLALALAGLFAGIGATLILAGLGLVWVSRGDLEIAPTKATVAAAPESKEPVGV